MKTSKNKKAKSLENRYLCIDTNIFIQCCFLEIDGDDLDVLTRLHKLLDQNKVKLLLPEIIKLEFYKRFRTKKSLLINEINRHKEDINKGGILNDKPKKDLNKILDGYIKDKEELSEKVKKEIELIFDHKNTVQTGLKITPEIFIESYKFFFTNLKPFKKETRSEKEKPDPIQNDCVIVESLKKFLASETNYKLYFCAQNTTDFAEDHLKSPIIIHKDIASRFKNITLYTNLGEVLNREFKLTISKKAIEKLSTVDEVSINTTPTNAEGVAPQSSS